MIKKKSRFLTVLFSIFPGAGHMYIGFMKTGVSLMSLFLFVIFLSSWLSIGSLLFVLPLIWFYSLFDCLNKTSLDDEQLATVEDKYLFSLDKLTKLDKDLLEKRSLAVGVIFVFVGIYFVMDNIIDLLSRYIPKEVYRTIYEFMRQSPKVIIGVVIVAIGIRLIKGKKRECEDICLRDEE